MEQGPRKHTEEYAFQVMKRYDPSHDEYHVRRVRNTALALAKATSSSIDLVVVEIAALLHDVLDKKYVAVEDLQDPFTFFTPFFLELSSQYGLDLISDGRGALIAKIIDNVSWSTEKKLRQSPNGSQWTQWHETCLELHCVQDADRLDAIGAFGILRCAAYSATVNQALHLPPEEEKPSAIHHFHDKLLHIHSRLKTPAGKALGQKRHDTLVQFLKSIDEEYAAQDLASD